MENKKEIKKVYKEDKNLEKVYLIHTFMNSEYINISFSEFKEIDKKSYKFIIENLNNELLNKKEKLNISIIFEIDEIIYDVEDENNNIVFQFFEDYDDVELEQLRLYAYEIMKGDINGKL